MTTSVPTGSAPPTTYGWDVVVASRVSRLNAGLAPVVQTLDETVANPGGAVRAVGSLHGCTIVAGGSGELVNLSFACPTLTLSNTQKSVTFKGGQVLVQTRFTFSAVGTHSKQSLSAVVGAGAATVLSATFPEPDFSTYETYAKTAAQQWLDQQTDLPYVFASLVPAVSPGAGTSAALAPVATSYAYADRSDGDGVLGLLCVLAGGADPASLLPEIDPDVVTAHDTVAVFSSQALTRLAGGLTDALGLTGAPGSITFAEPLSLQWDQTGATR